MYLSRIDHRVNTRIVVRDSMAPGVLGTHAAFRRIIFFFISREQAFNQSHGSTAATAWFWLLHSLRNYLPPRLTTLHTQHKTINRTQRKRTQCSSNQASSSPNPPCRRAELGLRKRRQRSRAPQTKIWKAPEVPIALRIKSARRFIRPNLQNGRTSADCNTAVLPTEACFGRDSLPFA